MYNGGTMSKLILLRGPSGSGKSTLARMLAEEYGDLTAGGMMPVLEADMYFEAYEGYKFDAEQLGNAHRWCQLNVERSMFHNEHLIVSNTSMTHWEVKPYLQLAKKYGYTVDVWRMPGPWDAEVLFNRNVHGVPLETLEKQIRKYQPLDNEREWEDLSIFNA